MNDLLAETSVIALADYMEHHMSLREFFDAFADIEDAHLPLETYLRKARRNAQRHYRAMSPQQRALEWNKITGTTGEPS